MVSLGRGSVKNVPGATGLNEFPGFIRFYSIFGCVNRRTIQTEKGEDLFGKVTAFCWLVLASRQFTGNVGW